MIDVSLCTPIQDANVYQFPLDLVSELLQQVSLNANADLNEDPSLDSHIQKLLIICKYKGII